MLGESIYTVEKSSAQFSERIDAVEEPICRPEKSPNAVEKSIYTLEERADMLGEPPVALEEPTYTVSERADTLEKWIVGLEKSSVALGEPIHTVLERADALCYPGEMAIKKLDHVSVVVDDLAAAIAFFTVLGMTVEGQAPIEGPWVDRINGLEDVRVDIVMMRTPDGHGRLELTKFRNPKLVEIEPAIAPPNALGLRSVMFTVDNVDDTVARLRANGAELVGEVAQYEDKYRLCYMRGPAGIIVALAEELF
jgi:catechol 2,3-dioxygenase-like lactoylglutathione lyase family enzyme